MTTHPASLAAAARDRLATWEPTIRAFVALDTEAFDRLDSTPSGLLGGLAVGVKDIIDVRGLPTRFGSRAFGDAPPCEHDARCVAALRDAGAVIVGKTTSTEFAFTDPTDTRNPYDPDRTPGGSSSGSGAAVGAGVLDLAIATQTAGSLCRPAAYCGVTGFKPTRCVVSTIGVAPLAPSFDTVGVIARDVGTAALAYRVWVGDPVDLLTPVHDAPWPSVGVAPLDPDAPMTAPALAARDAAAAGLAAHGAPVGTPMATVPFAAIVADHRRVMLHEAARHHGHLLARAPGTLQPNFSAALHEGLAIGADEADAARARLQTARDAFWRAMSDHDVLLACPVPASAPMRTAGTTGWQHLLTPWTVFGGPLLCLPWGVDPDGLPCAVMLCGAPGTDRAVLAAGLRLEALAPPRPRPATR
ncbi:MAG: amidase family protein [Burkholderiaceae bacterium]